MKKIISLALVLLIGLVLFFLAKGWGYSLLYPHPLEWARREIAPGMLREEAVATLVQRAWYHQACPNAATIDDLFFFGSHHWDRADIVIVRSDPVNGTYYVQQVSSFEPYAWHAAYTDCVNPARFKH